MANFMIRHVEKRVASHGSPIVRYTLKRGLKDFKRDYNGLQVRMHACMCAECDDDEKCRSATHSNCNVAIYMKCTEGGRVWEIKVTKLKKCAQQKFISTPTFVTFAKNMST